MSATTEARAWLATRPEHSEAPLDPMGARDVAGAIVGAFVTLACFSVAVASLWGLQ